MARPTVSTRVEASLPRRQAGVGIDSIRSQIKPERHLKENHYIAKPIDLTDSLASEISACSGAYVDPKRFLKDM